MKNFQLLLIFNPFFYMFAGFVFQSTGDKVKCFAVQSTGVEVAFSAKQSTM